MTNEQLAFEVDGLATYEELMAQESGDFNVEFIHNRAAEILREAAKRLRYGL
jgi:hypothetical protein